MLDERISDAHSAVGRPTRRKAPTEEARNIIKPMKAGERKKRLIERRGKSGKNKPEEIEQQLDTENEERIDQDLLIQHRFRAMDFQTINFIALSGRGYTNIIMLNFEF